MRVPSARGEAALRPNRLEVPHSDTRHRGRRIQLNVMKVRQRFLLLVLFLLSIWIAFAQSAPSLRVNGQRIMQHLQALAEFGKNPQGGVSRVAYTDADRQGREYAMRLMREAGLEVVIDPAGNIVGSRPGSEPSLKPVLMRSHIDSVPEGGNYDGDVGSLSA